MGALWPAAVPRDPAATLSTLLSGIRRALGAEVLQGRSELRLELPPDAIVDVEVAARALAEARGALPGEPTRSGLTAAQTALDIYESPLVPLFDAPWLEEHRRWQEEDRLETLEAPRRGGAGHRRRRSRARPAGGPAAGGAGPLPRIRPRAPHPRACRARKPRRGASVPSSGCGCCCARSWGPRPSPELRALHEQVLAAADGGTPRRPRPGRARPRPRPRSSPSSPGPRSGRSSGREAALGTLRDELAAASGGDRRFVLVAGEPGHRQDQPERRIRSGGARGGRDRALRAVGRGDPRAVPAVRGHGRPPRAERAGGRIRRRPPARARGAGPPRAGASAPRARAHRALVRPPGDGALPAVRGHDHDARHRGRHADDGPAVRRPPLVRPAHAAAAEAPGPRAGAGAPPRDRVLPGRRRGARPRRSPT